ncbi:MAG: YbhB/YbcL family Raf kinase inhibitor-like protein [Chitinispirillaceae bacterium]
MKLSSPAFENEGFIPPKYTCAGININPPLRVTDIPEKTESLCLIMHDPDSPSGNFLHWLDYNVEPVEAIDEGSRPGTQGKNDFGNIGYGGPCPSDGMHTYVLDAYALDSKLDLPQKAERKDVEQAMQEHILAKAELRGQFRK